MKGQILDICGMVIGYPKGVLPNLMSQSLYGKLYSSLYRYKMNVISRPNPYTRSM